MSTHRRIMHIDMDAFFASVEIARNPQLKGLPVAVGGPGSRRGVVAAASYEARKYGVHSAMPIFQARELCPSIVLVKPNFHLYSEVSRKIIRILRSFTPEVEPLSADESFLGLTGISHLWGTEEELARRIKEKIQLHCQGITCSIGIAPSRVSAKTASDFQKPDGITIIHDTKAFLRDLPLRDIPGIGRKTAAHLESEGLNTIAAVQDTTEKTLTALLGKVYGNFIYRAVRGTDSADIQSTRALPKSISRSSTLFENTKNPRLMLTVLAEMCDETTSELAWHDLYAKTVSIVIRYSNFETILRHTTLPDTSRSPREIFPHIRTLWYRNLEPYRMVRMVGMGLSNFTRKESSPTLFNFKQKEKEERLIGSVAEVRKYYGRDAIWWGSKELT